jgi:thiamine-phosphate pyrophosphorylase
MKTFPNRGLYAITQADNKTPDRLLADVAAAIRGGAVVIQYRDKNRGDRLSMARELAILCHRHDVPLIINDDAELAQQANADGVHLGKDDGDIHSARNFLGRNAIIGVSCYNSIERALDAQHQGATYVAFGRFFSSGSKPLASPADIDTLKEAKRQLHIPVVAIGGILPENGGQLLVAGADVLAAIGGVFDQAPEPSARAYQSLFGV